MLAMMASLGNRVWAYTRSRVSRWSRPRRVLRNVFQYATPGGSREWKSSLERRGAGGAAAVAAVALRERSCCRGDGDTLVAPRVASRPGGDCGGGGGGGGGACTHTGNVGKHSPRETKSAASWSRHSECCVPLRTSSLVLRALRFSQASTSLRSSCNSFATVVTCALGQVRRQSEESSSPCSSPLVTQSQTRAR